MTPTVLPQIKLFRGLVTYTGITQPGSQNESLNYWNKTMSPLDGDYISFSPQLRVTYTGIHQTTFIDWGISENHMFDHHPLFNRT